MIVNVGDVGDNKPHFISYQYDGEVEENIPKGTKVAAVVAVDGDLTLKNKIHYEIIGGKCSFVRYLRCILTNFIFYNSIDR